MQFNQIVGHSHLKNDLRKAVNDNKVSHALLFLGKFGYGSLPMAMAFTQYLFCENRGEDSCGTCSSCIKINDIQHPDVHFSFPTVLAINKLSSGFAADWRSQLKETAYFDLNHWTLSIDDKGRKPMIGTEESQDIIKKLSLKSYEGKQKVMIIWCANEMNPSAANKLLKILEEPPKDTVFILISESDDSMLQTILSRTQIVKIPKISSEDLSAYLRETKGIGNSLADSVAARSEGDLIVALEHIADATENVEKDLFIELMRVCYKKDVIKMLQWSEKMGLESRENQKTFLKYGLHMFRQSMLKNYTDDILIKVSQEENQFLVNFSKFITGNNIMDFMKTFNDGHYYVERNANARLLFTNICFQVMRFIHMA